MSKTATSLGHGLNIFSGFEALAVAVWLVPASQHVVRWPASGPERIAHFSSLANGVMLAAAAGATAGMLVGWARRNNQLPRLASMVAPLGLFWLWAVPYLPWLPDRLPLLLILSGPLRWFIAAAAVLAAVARAVPAAILRVRNFVEAHARTFVFVVSLVLYVGFGWVNARSMGPGGDEPHYLIISQSLLADGDLQIENNHQRREYEAFFGGQLRPDYMKRGLNGAIYSIHAPGLPALMLPAYAAFGYRGAVVFVCLIAALTALAIFDLAAALAGTGAGLATWAACCLTVPFLPHGWLLFPEMPGTLIVAWAILWVWRPVNDRPLLWLWHGIVLAWLPWLHTKFVIFLAVFAVALLWKLRARLRLAVVFAAPIAISAIAWLSFFYVIYGSFNPEAPYGEYPDVNILLKNIPRGLLGFVFDQKFGVLPYAPIYVFAAFGAWIAVRRRELWFFAGVLLLALAAHVGSTTRLYMWWGGSSAPARFLVPIVACLAPMMALAIAAIRTRVGRILVGMTLAASVVVALGGSVSPERMLLYSDPRGYSRLLEVIQSGAPVTFTMPTFTNEDWLSPIAVVARWLTAAAIALVVMVGAARARRASGLWLATLGCLAFLLSAAVVAARPDDEARDALARTGTMDLLWQYNGERFFEYDRLRPIDETRVRNLDVVSFDRYPPPQFALPEGAYEARVWFSGAMQRQGEVAVTSRGRIVLARAAGPFANPAVVPFELPVAVGRLSVAVSDDQTAANVVRIDIVPVALVPVKAREPRPTRAYESIAGRPGAFVAYLDDHEYPEGSSFWTRAKEAATVVVAPGSYSQIILTLHLGPHEGDVRLDGAGSTRTVRVERGQTAEVQLAVPKGARLVPITIQSPTTFRPSEVDRSSDDTRALGCQVRVDVR